MKCERFKKPFHVRGEILLCEMILMIVHGTKDGVVEMPVITIEIGKQIIGLWIHHRISRVEKLSFH